MRCLKGSHFAASLGYEVAPCALVKLRSGEFALFRKRFDRTTKKKAPRHIEDFCQLEEIPARMKYCYPMEEAADLIRRFSDTPAISLIRFFERAIFHFISGCGDVHYKNLRMLCRRVVVGQYSERQSKYDLEPLTDIMPPALRPADGEPELALPLHGKHTDIRRSDFEEFGEYLYLFDDGKWSVFGLYNVPDWTDLEVVVGNAED